MGWCRPTRVRTSCRHGRNRALRVPRPGRAAPSRVRAAGQHGRLRRAWGVAPDAAQVSQVQPQRVHVSRGHGRPVPVCGGAEGGGRRGWGGVLGGASGVLGGPAPGGWRGVARAAAPCRCRTAVAQHSWGRGDPHALDARRCRRCLVVAAACERHRVALARELQPGLVAYARVAAGDYDALGGARGHGRTAAIKASPGGKGVRVLAGPSPCCCDAHHVARCRACARRTRWIPRGWRRSLAPL